MIFSSIIMTEFLYALNITNIWIPYNTLAALGQTYRASCFFQSRLRLLHKHYTKTLDDKFQMHCHLISKNSNILLNNTIYGFNQSQNALFYYHVKNGNTLRGCIAYPNINEMINFQCIHSTTNNNIQSALYCTERKHNVVKKYSIEELNHQCLYLFAYYLNICYNFKRLKY